MTEQTYHESADNLVGRTLQGRFEIVRLLKASPHTIVSLGRDLARSNASIVVKYSKVQRVASASLLRLENEAIILSTLQTAAVAPILHFGRENDAYFLVAPFIEGISLQERLRLGPLDEIEVLSLGIAMASALTEVHAHGILHRDIKPSNIIVNPEGLLEEATLIDFGQAKSVQSKAPLGEALAFTALYAAPEQTGLIHSGVDARSDLYSLGIVLYETLKGRPPFQATDLNDLLMQHLSAPPPPLGSGTSESLAGLILRLLAKDPRDRYQSAASLGRDLQEIANAHQRGERHYRFTLGAWDKRESLTEPSFIGRHAEMAELNALVREATAGKGHIIGLSAPSGQGKSRVLAELARQVHSTGQLVFEGQGIIDAAARPYQMLSGIASGLTEACRHDRHLAEHLRQELRIHAATLCTIMPLLAAVLEPENSFENTREAFAEKRNVQALAAFFAALSVAPYGAVFLFDDAQWVDTASMRLLMEWQAMHRSNSRGKSQTCFAMVFAFRVDEASREPLSPLQTLCHHNIELSPLTNDDIGKILSSMAGPLPAAVVRKLTELAAHSPFMATALLRGMAESGALRPGPDGWLASPEALASLQSSRRAAAILTRRLESFSTEALSFLSQAALLGKTFDVTAAITLAGCPPATGLKILALAQRRKIVWEEHEEGRYCFAHDKLREALIERIPPEERRSFHSRAAELMEAEADPFKLAYHFDAAGESARAYPYALKAAQQARKQSALAAAEQYYRIADRCLPPDQLSEGAEIAQALGEVLMFQGDYVEASQQMERAKKLASSRTQRVKIQMGLGELAMKRGQSTESIAALTEALALLGHHVPQHHLVFIICLLWEVVIQALHSLRLYFWPNYASHRPLDVETSLSLQIFSHLYFVFWFKGSLPAAWIHLRCLNMAERYAPSSHLAQAYCDHAAIASIIPLHQRSQASTLRSLAIRRQLNDQWGIGHSLGFYGATLYINSRFEEAMTINAEAVPLLEATGDRWTIILMKWGRAHFYYRLGDLRTCVEACREVYDESLDIGDFSTTGIVLSLWSLASQGNAPAELLAREKERNYSNEQTKACLLVAEGVQALHAGHFAEAIAALDQAVRIIDKAKLRHEYIAHIRLWLVTALRTGAESLNPIDPQYEIWMRAANTHWCKGIKLARSFANNLPHALREGAILAARQRRSERAHKLINASLALAERQKARYEYAKSLEVRGRLGSYFTWEGAARDRTEAMCRLKEVHESLHPPKAKDTEDERSDYSLLTRFEIVLEGGHSIITALDPSAIAAALLATAKKLFRSQRCLVIKVGAAEDSYTVLAGDRQPIFSRTLLQRALAEGAALAVDESRDASTSESLVLADVRSALCVPIYKEGQAVACLYVSHSLVGQLFHNSELKLAQFLAVLAGAALENADSFDRMQSYNTSLTRLASERQLIADELRNAKNLAEAGSRAKTEFLSNMSHEMRTPLVTILNFSNFLANRDLSPEEVQQFLGTIDRNGKALIRLIDDALDLTKAEAGVLEVEKTSFLLHDFLFGLINTHERPAKDKGLSLTLTAPPTLPSIIYSDPKRLNHALFHLIDNAIKFTKHGGVNISVTSVKGGLLHFTVTDSGCGIPLTMQGKIFERFAQIDTSNTRRYGGCGIGLYLASKIAKALGGCLKLDSSEPNQGSVFTLVLNPRSPPSRKLT